MRIAYEKETNESIIAEHTRVNDEISNLRSSTIHVNQVKNVTMNHKIFLTMMDVKSINAIEGNKSTQVIKKNYDNYPRNYQNRNFDTVNLFSLLSLYLELLYLWLWSIKNE